MENISSKGIIRINIDGYSETYTYFLENSFTLIRKLLTGEGDAKTRLKKSEFEVSFLLSFDVPSHLISLRKKIKCSLCKRPALILNDKIYKTSYQNSLVGIRNSTASKIIGDIYSLHLRVGWHNTEIKKEKSY